MMNEYDISFFCINLKKKKNIFLQFWAALYMVDCLFYSIEEKKSIVPHAIKVSEYYYLA